jgi:hypothetical protein
LGPKAKPVRPVTVPNALVCARQFNELNTPDTA